MLLHKGVREVVRGEGGRELRPPEILSFDRLVGRIAIEAGNEVWAMVPVVLVDPPAEWAASIPFIPGLLMGQAIFDPPGMPQPRPVDLCVLEVGVRQVCGRNGHSAKVRLDE